MTAHQLTRFAEILAALGETNDERCETCRFSLRPERGTGATVWCRRRPPRRRLKYRYETDEGWHEYQYDEASFPAASAHDWCGEYQPRGTTK